MLKGRFILPIVFKNYIKGERNFNLNIFYNIRKSSYTKRFINCVFHIHNGKFFVSNDPVYLKISIKKMRCSFKLGQFSYNKHIHSKGGINSNSLLLLEDIKKKRGVSVKIRKKKKLIFTKV